MALFHSQTRRHMIIRVTKLRAKSTDGRTAVISGYLHFIQHVLISEKIQT